jgi:hypothetical protein
MNQVISYGAGVNSTAMIIWLYNHGWSGHIVFSDTGCEWPETYCYIKYFESEWLNPRGLYVQKLHGLPYHRLAGGISLIDYCESHHKIPMAAVRWCTMDYKVRALGYWCEANHFPEQLIGIAYDEQHRRPDANRPLVDNYLTRDNCISIIEAEGLDVPRKSGCYICPFQRPSGWRELWKVHPDIYERAAVLEETASHNSEDGHRFTLDPAGKVTLRQRQASFEAQIPMFEETDWDTLLRFKPCICELGEDVTVPGGTL